MRWRVFILLLIAGMRVESQTAPVCTGTVVDQRGNPVAGVDIAQFWLGGTPETSGFRPYGATKSDAQGKFKIKLNESRLPTTLFAMDSERARGAVIAISDAAAATNQRVQLQPLHAVRYVFRAPGLTDLSQSRITVHPRSGPMFSQIVGPTGGVFSLPPGKYALSIPSPGDEREVDFEVSTGDVALDAIEIPANIAQYYDHPAPPLTTVDAANVDSFSADRLRGKWVLVYFWGYWCAPCVNEGLPKLAKFYEENRGHLDKFEILAVHENGVVGPLGVDDLKSKLAMLVRDKWAGKALPFPVLLDRSGKTIKTWGISAYPTIAIINPHGELMRGDLETLREKLVLP